MLKTLSSRKWAAQFFPVIKIAGDAAVRAPVALNKAVCLIGRRLGVHLPLDSTKVSKVHALIVRHRDGVYIRDLASRNHTYVNDEAVTEAELANGDVVRIGPFSLNCASGFDGSAETIETAAAAAAAAAHDPPEAALQTVGEGTRIALAARRAILIGQRDECDLTLADDPRVAPVHAVVFEMNGRRFLRDLNSSAGAFVNNQSVRQQELAAGDEIRIGRTRIRYEVEGVSAPDEPTRGRKAQAPFEQGIDLSELDDADRISLDDDDSSGEGDDVEAIDPIDPIDHPLAAPQASDAPDGEQRIALETGESVPGVIDQGMQAVTLAKVDPDSSRPVAAAEPDIVSIPLPTGGGLEWTQPDRPAPLPPLAPLPGTETASADGDGGDDPDRALAAQLVHPFAGEEPHDLQRTADPQSPPPPPGHDDDPAHRKLDRIVSELSDKVEELKTVWDNVRPDEEDAEIKNDESND